MDQKQLQQISILQIEILLVQANVRIIFWGTYKYYAFIDQF